MPDGQSPLSTDDYGCLILRTWIDNLDPIQGARDASVDVAPDESTYDNDDCQERGGASQTVEFPGTMQ